MLRGLFGSKDNKKSDFEIEEEPEEKGTLPLLSEHPPSIYEL